jgi:hypothetical protein
MGLPMPWSTDEFVAEFRENTFSYRSNLGLISNS